MWSNCCVFRVEVERTGSADTCRDVLLILEKKGDRKALPLTTLILELMVGGRDLRHIRGLLFVLRKREDREPSPFLYWDFRVKGGEDRICGHMG